MKEVYVYNQAAWDAQVARGNTWTQPVSQEAINKARRGDWGIVLTNRRKVPVTWFPNLHECRILCLAAGGGQQAPILAAAGAKVTLLDASRAQLDQDRMVAERDGLDLTLVQGDMAQLPSLFDRASFDVILNPVSNCFVPELEPVWQGCAKVLSEGGRLLSGFFNPWYFVFDERAHQDGRLEVRHAIPYHDGMLTDEEIQALRDQDEPFVFGHTLDDQIGGQMRAGFALIQMYEDVTGDKVIDQFGPSFLATLSVKWDVS